LVQRLL